MKKVLITGGAGFIGSHLARQLCRRYAVTIVDDLSTGSRDNLQDIKNRVEIKIMALEGPGFRTWLRGRDFSAVFHLAGNGYTPVSVEAPLLDAHKNIVVTLHLVSCLSALPRPPRFIYSSSAAVYGEPATLPIRETTPLRPISPYGIGKLSVEKYLHYFHKNTGLPLQILRFFSCYGPGHRKQVVWDLAQKLRQKPDQLPVVGTGAETRDLIYVEDLVRAVEICYRKGEWEGDTYQIATGAEITVRKLAETMRDLVSPETHLAFDGKVRTGDPVRWKADIRKIRELGFKPQTSLRAGLAKTVAWITEVE